MEATPQLAQTKRYVWQIALGVLVLAAVIAGPFIGISRDKRVPETAVAPQEAASIAMTQVLNEFVQTDGKVVGADEPRLRDQSVALLLAAVNADKSKFDAIWNATRSTITSMSYGESDPSNSVDIMRVIDAFAIAEKRLQGVQNMDEPKRIAAKLADSATTVGGVTVIGAKPLMQTTSGTSTASAFSGYELNARLLTPSMFDRIARFTSDARWTVFANDARTLRQRARFGDDRRLIVTPIVLQGDGSLSQPTKDAIYQDDAQLIPLDAVQGCNANDNAFAASYWRTLRTTSHTRTATALSWNGRVVKKQQSPHATVASAAAAKASGEVLQADALVNMAEAIARRNNTFDQRAIVALGRASIDTETIRLCA